MVSGTETVTNRAPNTPPNSSSCEWGASNSLFAFLFVELIAIKTRMVIPVDDEDSVTTKISNNAQFRSLGFYLL